MQKWDTANYHTHLLTFASVDGCSDVRVGQEIGDSHRVGGLVAADAQTGDICCHWRARERLYWCQWIDFIPPRCQKPPAPFCLLSPAADHSAAVCVCAAAALGDTQKDRLRSVIGMLWIKKTSLESKLWRCIRSTSSSTFGWAEKSSAVPEVGFLRVQTSCYYGSMDTSTSTQRRLEATWKVAKVLKCDKTAKPHTQPK